MPGNNDINITKKLLINLITKFEESNDTQIHECITKFVELSKEVVSFDLIKTIISQKK